MIQEIEQLRKLILEGGYDEESKKTLDDLQNRVQKAIASERLLENTFIAEAVDYLKTEAERCTVLLANDRKLTELQREVLFEKREICQRLLAFFQPFDMLKLEEEIKSLLNVVKAQS
jgi:hypothetical protein